MSTDRGARQKHFQSQLILLGDLKVLYGNIINSVFSQKPFGYFKRQIYDIIWKAKVSNTFYSNIITLILSKVV